MKIARKLALAPVFSLAVAFAAGLPGTASATADKHDHAAHAGHEGHADHGAQAGTSDKPVETAASTGTRDARAYFTDAPLLTQDGRGVKFYSDVLKDRVVLLNVVFTNCDDACPLITRKLKEVRAALGDEAAAKVHFVSISSDPVRDSPQALKAFAKKNEADVPNWTFLTGDKANVDLVLARLGQLGETPEGHSTLLIAGDVAAKRWSKIRPDAAPHAIAERLKLLATPLASAAAGPGIAK